MGPHFRSYESVAFMLHDLPKSLKVDVWVSYLGECHGTGPVDNEFGWSRGWTNAFLNADEIIHGIQNLVKCYGLGAEAMRNLDPGALDFVIAAVAPCW